MVPVYQIAVIAAVCLCLVTPHAARQEHNRRRRPLTANQSIVQQHVHPDGSRQCVVNEDLYNVLLMMKCKLADANEIVQNLREQNALLKEAQDDQKEQIRSLKEAQDAQKTQINSLLARVEASENKLENIENDKTFQSQATFYARGLQSRYTSDAYSDGDRLIYQTPVINPGGHYNSTSGEYTCPTSGVYMFMYSVHGAQIKQGSSYSCVTASLYKAGDRVSDVLYKNDNSEYTYLTVSHTDVVSCETGQRVWVEGDWDRNFISNYRSSRNVFGGVLLYTT